MYDRVGLYRGKKSLCCVNNSKRHLTKRFMGNKGGYKAVCGPEIPEQCHFNWDGISYHEYPPEESGQRPEPKCLRDRLVRFGKNKVLAHSPAPSGPFLVCVRRPQRRHPRPVRPLFAETGL